MTIIAQLTFLGDQSQWSEDVVWLAENRAWDTVGHLATRIRWLHVYLEETRGARDVLARIQLDIAGQDLWSVCAIRTCPQAALCAAFDQLRHEIQREELVVPPTSFLPARVNLSQEDLALDRALRR